MTSRTSVRQILTRQSRSSTKQRMLWVVLIRKVCRKWKSMPLLQVWLSWYLRQSASFLGKKKLGTTPKRKFSADWICSTFSVASRQEPWLKNKSRSWDKLISMIQTSILIKSKRCPLLPKVSAFGSVPCKLSLGSKRKCSPRKQSWKRQNNHWRLWSLS